MAEPTPRFWEVFFEVYEALPRQGPGNRDCAAKALALCRDLPSAPAVLDLGCGVGGQTLYLAELTAGSIVAVDSHAPSIDRLRQVVSDRGLANRIRPMVGDMAHPTFPPASLSFIAGTPSTTPTSSSWPAAAGDAVDARSRVWSGGRRMIRSRRVTKEESR